MSSHILMLLDNPYKSDFRVKKEIKSLISAGYKITLICTTAPNLPESEIKDSFTIKRIIDNDILLHPLSRPYQKMVSSIKSEFRNRDVIVIHCHDFRMLLIGVVLKEAFRAKIVYDSHEFLHGYPMHRDASSFSNKLKGFLMWQYFKWREKKAMKAVDVVITVNQSLSKEFVKQFHLSVEPTVVRNIPERIEESDSQMNFLREHFGLTKKQFILVHSGNLYFSKNDLQVLLKSLREIPELKLVLILSQDKYQMEIDFLRKEDATGQLYFLDFPESKELHRILQSADAGLFFTSKIEWLTQRLSLPNRVFEYSMAGIPILSLPLPEIRNYGQEYEHIIYFKSLQALKGAIIELRAQYHQIKSRAMSAARHVSWTTEAEQLLKIYEQLK